MREGEHVCSCARTLGTLVYKSCTWFWPLRQPNKKETSIRLKPEKGVVTDHIDECVMVSNIEERPIDLLLGYNSRSIKCEVWQEDLRQARRSCRADPRHGATGQLG